MWNAGKFTQNTGKFVKNTGKFVKNTGNFLDQKKKLEQKLKMIMWDTGKIAQNTAKFAKNVGKFPKNIDNFLDKKTEQNEQWSCRIHYLSIFVVFSLFLYADKCSASQKMRSPNIIQINFGMNRIYPLPPWLKGFFLLK